MSRFGIVWTGFLSGKYNDPHAEIQREDGTHWVYRVNSSKSGKPEPVLISTFDEQRRFCSEEGLSRPQDCDRGFITSDGKGLKTVTAKETVEFREHSNHVAAVTAAQEKL